MSNSEPVDRASPETTAVRQGTGPRQTVSVLVISLMLAAALGAALLGYYML
jgi:hypothetical protein